MPHDLDQARATLERYFGYRDFRAGQVDVVASVLSGADTLGVLPTGGGKSLCYQVPALVLPGLTVVISPLISLMKDQVDRLHSRGVPAAFLNSTLPAEQVAGTLARARSGALKLLYAAPERFEAQDLLHCLSACRVSLLAVDEAHCISEWGHDFRPSFRRIATANERIGRPQIIALTATATPAVRRDIERQLRLRQPRVIVCGFDRTNLSYEVRSCRSEAAKERTMLATLRRHGRPSIVYASTRGTVDRIARRLAGAGIRAAGYHGGLRDVVRHEVQERFMRGSVETIVATNAFGMGIDKPNVRLVVHYAMPGTLESYYQEAGRAGRDGLPGHCVLLHAPGDRQTHEWFISGTFPDRAVVREVHRALRDASIGRSPPLMPSTLARRCAGLDARAVESALRLLEQYELIAKQSADDAVWLRLLATPARIRAELRDASDAGSLRMLRALWRLHGERLYDGLTVSPITLDRGTTDRALAALRARQFVDFSALGGMRLRDPSATFDDLPIEWATLERRRRGELAKLDMMEGYVRTRKCRRAFVLAYFGERGTARACAGCDNCLRP